MVGYANPGTDTCCFNVIRQVLRFCRVSANDIPVPVSCEHMRPRYGFPSGSRYKFPDDWEELFLLQNASIQRALGPIYLHVRGSRGSAGG